jgi:hypothetical protein
MNDLRRILLWLSILGILAIGVWGLQWDERSDARPFAPEYREFRQNHRLEVLGFVFYVPLVRMLCAWGAVLCAAAGLWPFATPERSRQWLGEWERPGPDGFRRDGRR